MFPSTSSRETLTFSGKQNKLFPSGADIKFIIFRVSDTSTIQLNIETNVNIPKGVDQGFLLLKVWCGLAY